MGQAGLLMGGRPPNGGTGCLIWGWPFNGVGTGCLIGGWLNGIQPQLNKIIKSDQIFIPKSNNHHHHPISSYNINASSNRQVMRFP